MSDEAPLLDFAELARRLRAATVVLGALAVGGTAVEVALGAGAGVGVASLRWATGAVAALLLATAVLVALQAYRAADTAQRRGERLSGDDVGLTPPRRRRELP